MRLTTILSLFFVFLGCKDSNILDLPTTNIENKQFYTPYCIYQLGDEGTIKIADIKNLISSKLSLYKFVDSLSGENGQCEYIIEQFNDPKNEYPAPDLEYLQHSSHNLSDNEKVQLQSPETAVLIAFSGTNENVISDQIRINEIIDSLIKDKNAVVTDYTTYESFNSFSWNKNRVSHFNETNQDITSQFTTHLYREDQFCRAITLGLGKFCLPDISIENISCSNQMTFGYLINLISQTWLENPVIRIDTSLIVDINNLKNDSLRTILERSLLENAERSALIKLSSVFPQEGDAYNTQFEITFNDPKFSSKQEEQQALTSQLFGATDAVEYIEHNEEILEASQKAKGNLPALKEKFNLGLEPGYSLLLKAPFKTDVGGKEWMWIEVTVWSGSKITGILQNDPFEIFDLRAGEIVSFEQGDVFDYMYYHPDGTSEGNETGKIISRG